MSRRRGHLLTRLSGISETFGIALFVTESNDVGGGFAQYEHNYICLSLAAATHRFEYKVLSVYFHELGHFVLYRLGRHMHLPSPRSVRTMAQLQQVIATAVRNERKADRMGKKLMESNFPTRKGEFAPGYPSQTEIEWLKDKLKQTYRFVKQAT